MTEDRRSLVERTIADFEASGVPWTNLMVFDKVSGNYGELSQYLKERRAGAGTSVATASPSVTTQEPPAALADTDLAAAQARHAERKARSLATLQAVRTAPPAPTPPLRVDPPSIHYTGPPPIILGSTAPDTRPKLVRAREEVQRYQDLVNRASSQTRPLEADIARVQARQTQLTAADAKAQTVDALRAIRAELAELALALEILQRQYAPLAQVVRSVSGSLRQASDTYGVVRAQAVDALEKARAQHFHGQSDADKQKRFRELAALVGAEEVQQYVTDLTEEAQCRYRQHNPPWRGHQHGLLD